MALDSPYVWEFWAATQTAPGTFPIKHPLDEAFSGAHSVYAADVDGDGDMDVLGAAWSHDDIAWWENDVGDGSAWTEHPLNVNYDAAISVYAADVDGDGDVDVLGAANYADDITWWENDAGDGSTWTERTVDGDFDGARSVYAADVDGDGDMDVLGAAELADDITWWENTLGDGTAWTENTVAGDLDGAYSVHSADVDGDGDMDVLGAGYVASDILWWENTAGNGTTWTQHTVDLTFDGAYCVSTADVDGDGALDVLGAAQNANDITWWDNTSGDGSTWIKNTVDADFSGARSVHAADVDGDGDLDLLGAAFNADEAAWWDNTSGDGTTWTEHAVDGSFDGVTSLHAADVDGDGDLDVLGASWNASDIVWWENASVSVTTTTPVGNEAAAPQTTDVDATFNLSMNAATATTFVVHGSMTGERGGVYSGDGTATLTFDPTDDFESGEHVRVTLTTGLTSTGSLALGAPYGWEFLASAGAGSGAFPIGHTVDAAIDGPAFVHAADVDGDGDLDVLGAATDADDIAWWENTAGNGSAWTENTVDGDLDGASWVQAADVDGDGDMDVVGAAAEAHDIAWWENTAGNGTAWSEHTVDASFNAVSCVHAADVDGDGDMDVLGTGPGTDRINWWENTAGDGSAWTEHYVVESFDGAVSVYAADVDGDGDIDVLGAASNDDEIAWWENTSGDGTAWTEHAVASGFDYAISVHAADVDGDGDLDVLGAAAYDDEISWWENDAGDGSLWAEHTLVADFDGANCVYSADVDGDGDMDIMGAANNTSDSAADIAWWENAAGDGTTWTEHIVRRDFFRALSVRAGDVDGDGDLDILGATRLADDITWWENALAVTATIPSGNAAAAVSTDVSATFSDNMNVGDAATFIVHGSMTGERGGVYAGGGTPTLTFNPDADFEPGERVRVTVTTGLMSTGAEALGAPHVWEFLAAAGVGPGTFPSEHAVDSNFNNAVSVSAADVDGDGDLDVLGAARMDNDITWWENTAGDGSAWTEHIVDGDFSYARSVHAADVDGDGDVDVLGAAADADDIAWWENTLGDGSAWIEHTVDADFDYATSVHAADVDGDGDLDVLGAAYLASDIAWWENTAGDGSSWTEHTVDGDFAQAYCVYAADVDGDGDLDVLGAAQNADAIAWWENTLGDGTSWTEHTVDGAFDGAHFVYAADVDGDGDLDVLGAAQNADAITWWENTAGDGTAWTEHAVDAAFDGAWSVYSADVDGDGDLDVLGAALTADAITWWENTLGDGTSWTEHTVDGAFDAAQSVYAADVDGDGDLDVLGAAEGADDITWWENGAILPVTAVAPDQNYLDAALTANVTATFSDNMNVGTAGTFVVHGSMTGERTGAYDGGGTATLSFDPTADFHPGERVAVTLTSGLTSTGGGTYLSSYVWEFLAGAGAAPGTFAFEHTVAEAFDGALSVYSADVDGDGDLDIVGAASGANDIAWWENTAGDGSAWTEHTVDGLFDAAACVHAADVDGDGDLDVLGAASYADDIAWWANTSGNGTTWTEHTVDADFSAATCVYAADVNGDGDVDVLGAAIGADDIAWWANDNGDGSAWTEYPVDVDFDYAFSVSAADVDGDGDLDVLGAAYYADDITWWENTAVDGSLWTEHTVDAEFNGAKSVHAADVDGDGDLDILGAANADDDITWWENDDIPETTPAAVLSGASTALPGDEIRIFSIGLTGDGIASISAIALTISDLSTPTGLAAGDFTELRLYSSTDATLGGGDTQIGTQATINLGSATTVSATTPDTPPDAMETFYLVSAVLAPGATPGHALKVGFAAGGVTTSSGARGTAVAASDDDRATISDITETTTAAVLSGASTAVPGDEIRIFSIGLTGDGIAAVLSVALTISDLSTPTGLAAGDFAELRLYTSSDPTLDGSDTQIGSEVTINLGSATTVSATTPHTPPDAMVTFYLVSAVLAPGAAPGHALKVGFAAGGVSTSTGGKGTAVAASDDARATISDITETTTTAVLSGASTAVPGDEVRVFAIGLTGDGIASVSAIALTISDLSAPTGLAAGDLAELRLYTSADATLGGGDTQIGTQTTVNLGSATTVSATTPHTPPDAAETFYLVSAVYSSGASPGHALKAGFAAGGVSTSAGGKGSAVAASDDDRIILRVTTPTLVTHGGAAYDWGLMPTFNWDDVFGAVSYTLEYADNALFAHSTRVTGIVASQHDLSPVPPLDTYYWRVKAIGPGGVEGDYSTADSFVIVPTFTEWTVILLALAMAGLMFWYRRRVWG